MKLSLLSISCSAFLFLANQSVFAAPNGDIVIHNASNKTVVAQVSTFGKFNLAANGQRNVSYSTLERACSSNPTTCTAQFFVDNKPAGSATINTITGKLVRMKLLMKVRTAKSQQILRSVVIQ